MSATGGMTFDFDEEKHPRDEKGRWAHGDLPHGTSAAPLAKKGFTRLELPGKRGYAVVRSSLSPHSNLPPLPRGTAWMSEVQARTTGKGDGLKLYEAALTWAKANGLSGIASHGSLRSEAANRFWRSMSEHGAKVERRGEWLVVTAIPHGNRQFAAETFEAKPKVASIRASDEMPNLSAELKSIFEASYLDAATTVASLRDSSAILANVASRAEAYASSRSGSQIAGIDETTQERVQAIISDAITNGTDPTDRLSTLFGPERADMIAETETNTAFNMGTILALKDAGEEYVYATDGEEFDEDCASWNDQIVTIEEAEAEPLGHPWCVRDFRPLTNEELAEVMSEESDDSSASLAADPEIAARLEALERRVFEYDEDLHPRDEKGRWTDAGGGAVVAWHGTVDSVLAGVKKDGLTVGNARSFQNGVLYQGERGRAVFVSDTPHAAAHYADLKGFETGHQPVILELRIPKSAWAGFKADRLHEGATRSAFTTKTISPRWITRAFTYDPHAPYDSAFTPRKFTADGDESAWVVLLIAEGEEKFGGDFDEEKHPRDERGRFADAAAAIDKAPEVTPADTGYQRGATGGQLMQNPIALAHEGATSAARTAIVAAGVEGKVDLSKDDFWTREATLTDLPISTLASEQKAVEKDVMREKVKAQSEPISVLRHNGQLLIRDGNHRAAAALLRGEHTIKAYVVDVDRMATLPGKGVYGAEKFYSEDQLRDEKGRWTTGGGSRAWNGKTMTVKSEKLSWRATGRIGEHVVKHYLENQGKKVEQTSVTRSQNFPVDLVTKNEIIDVKAGLVSNGPSGWQWRLTLGEPHEKEKAWLAKATPEQKARHNERKMLAVLDRKERTRIELQKEMGRSLKATTYAVILHPDTGKADLYRFDGFHPRIGWKGDMAKKGFVATLTYGRKK